MHTLGALGTMKPEINAAVGFLSRFMRIKGHVNDRQLQTFSQNLQDILTGKYQHLQTNINVIISTFYVCVSFVCEKCGKTSISLFMS